MRKAYEWLIWVVTGYTPPIPPEKRLPIPRTQPVLPPDAVLHEVN